jgi:hypothetical protein
MVELASALDALAAHDLHALPAGAQLDRIRKLAQARNRLDAELARSVRVAEATQAAEHDGQKTMASWLRGHCHYSPRAAGLLVRNGRALAHLPSVAAACAEGLLTADQLAVIAPIAAPDRLAAAADQGVDLAGIEAALIDVATGQRYDRLGQAVEHYLNRLDPDGPEPDPTEGRSLHITKHADGSVSGRFDLDAVGAERVQTVLESFLQAGRTAGDDRSRAQQLADALVQWADVTLAAGSAPILRTHKPQVIVTIPLADLVGPDTGPGAGRMGFGAEISAARARWLACDGGITRVVIGPESQPLDLGRTQRITPPHLRRAVEVRDDTCVFAGCSAPHHWCDAHHVLEWYADDGPTSLENSGLLCERHHTKVHHGFRIERDPGGTWHTYRPDGTEILVHAPPPQ